VARVYYPLTPTAEVLARIVFSRDGAPPVGLSAVHVVVKREGSEPIEGTTEFDGTVAFEALPAGKYTLTLDPEQAARLHMRLKAPIAFTVDPEGGFLSDIVGEVIFDRDAQGGALS
jgi:hypothetical protein